MTASSDPQVMTEAKTPATRVNVMLDAGTLEFMNRETARIRAQFGVTLGRSEMVRSVFLALSDAGLNFGNCKTEANVRHAMALHLQRVADLVRKERAEQAAKSVAGRRVR